MAGGALFLVDFPAIFQIALGARDDHDLFSHEQPGQRILRPFVGRHFGIQLDARQVGSDVLDILVGQLTFLRVGEHRDIDPRPRAKTPQLAFDVFDLLAGNARVLPLLAALAVVAVAGGAGTVDFLAFFEVDRSNRIAHGKDGKKERETQEIQHAGQLPKSMRRIVAPLKQLKIDTNHA
jgi:hypothetical protein